MPPTDPAETDLVRLCQYYLDCLARDADDGVTVPAADADSDGTTPGYAELSSMPLASRDAQNAVRDERALELLGRIARDRTSIAQLGYPVALRRARDRADGFCLEPVLLWPLDTEGVLAEDIPGINFAALKALPNAGSGRAIDEVIQLSHDLGLGGEPADLPGFDELIRRLHQLRPYWPWREPPDPYRLTDEPPLAAIDLPGLYNRCLVVQGARSPYTQGLETELARLAQVGEPQSAGTALGDWLRGAPPEGETPGDPLLEVLPLNEEQREAIRQALASRLTVVTGPPGTGKSQLVAVLLANAAWRGQKVLFASKNNKAVDVVEERVNRLGPRPLLLRLGWKRQQCLTYLSSLRSATVDAEDEAEYRRCLEMHERLRAADAGLQSDLDAVVALRNEVDRLEQACEYARARLGERLFASMTEDRLRAWRRTVDAFADAALDAIPAGKPLWMRCLWPLLRRARFERLRDTRMCSTPVADALGLPLIAEENPRDHPTACLEEAKQLADRLGDVETVVRYRHRLFDLHHARTPTAIAAERRALLDRLVANSIGLWHAWLNVLPARMPRSARSCLTAFVQVLRMLEDANGTRGDARRDTFKRLRKQYYNLFPKIARYLPAWAVTALSARGRLPFRPATFDLVVIDEASQCDIASAIPLLYRAKRAVIIGDPKQLRHITKINPVQDGLLLDRHGLLKSRVNWSYATNSLYDLARSLVGPDHIVMLRDHFRSHPAIIGFSNAAFYDGRLRMATRLDGLRRPQRNGRPEPALSWRQVAGRVARPSEGGAVNQTEAKAVVAELRRLVTTLDYDGSIGVVTPFRAQANQIRRLVRSDQGLADRLHRLDLVVDTAYGFQGDERDVMVFSPVVSDGTPPGALWYLNNEPNLFNVAITRARAALIAVGDRGAAQRSRVGYLRRFALYVAALDDWSPQPRALADDPGPTYPPVRHPERVSQWERFLYDALRNAGLQPIPQYAFAGMLLDFALLEGDRRLAIEVDGEMYHRAWDGDYCRRDQVRNWRLLEAGWDVERIWVYEIRDNLEDVVRRIVSWHQRAARPSDERAA